MNRLLLCGILLLQLTAIAQKQTTVSGKIINGKTTSGVEGATVINLSTQETNLSNEQGLFHFRSALLPSDSLYISAIGFEPAIILYQSIIDQNKTYSLTPKPVLLQEIIVNSNPTSSNQIISKLDIKLRGINNSQEALRMIPGLFIGQHAGGGKAEQIFLRGFDIDHGTDISISVDGMPVNMVSHAHGQGYADLHFVIPELIDHVNFKKGTYYPEKGNFTTTGYVDFKTVNVLPKNSIKLEAGQFNTFRGVAQVNLLGKSAQQREQSAFMATEVIQSDGYFESPQNFKRYNVFGKYFGKLNERNHLNFSTSTFLSKWNASGQIPERAILSKQIGYFGAIDPTEGGHTSRSNINAILTTNLTNGGLIKNQFFYSRYQFKLYSNFTFYKEDPINGDQIRQAEKRDIYGYNSSYSQTKYIRNIKWQSEIGANIRADKTNGSELSRTKDREMITNAIKLGNITEANASAYYNGTITFSPRVTLQTGLRYDHLFSRYEDELDNNTVGRANTGILLPKLNLFYQLNKNTQFYLMNGRGFHSNDARVVVPQNGLDILPPAFGNDLGIVSKLGNDLFINAAIWHLYLQQEFIYVGDEGIVEPSGKTRRYGFDLSLRYQPISQLFFDLDLNYSRGRNLADPKGQNYLPLAPSFTSIGGITYKSSKQLNGSLRYRYMGDRPANADYSLVAKGYFITDLFVNYTKQKFETGLSVQNLFNIRWKETQFDTESQLKNEAAPISEIHFTPGTPFFLKASFTYFF